jgi:hypothetical protein
MASEYGAKTHRPKKDFSGFFLLFSVLLATCLNNSATTGYLALMQPFD